MKKIMTRAWELYKNTDGALFSECLKEAWRESKNKVKKYIMNDWIYTENYLHEEVEMKGKRRELKKEYGFCVCSYSKYFTSENIIKETEKAYLVDVQGEYEIKDEYKKEIWIPKSCVENI